MKKLLVVILVSLFTVGFASAHAGSKPYHCH